MATVSELTSKNIANAQANVQTWGNIIVNVEVYGADLTGVTDSTAVFQEAIAYAKSNGKVLFIPKGTLKLSATFDSSQLNDLIIRGSGIRTTTVRIVGDIPLFDMRGVKYFTISELTITVDELSTSTVFDGQNNSAVEIKGNVIRDISIMKETIGGVGTYGGIILQSIDTTGGVVYNNIINVDIRDCKNGILFKVVKPLVAENVAWCTSNIVSGCKVLGFSERGMGNYNESPVGNLGTNTNTANIFENVVVQDLLSDVAITRYGLVIDGNLNTFINPTVWSDGTAGTLYGVEFRNGDVYGNALKNGYIEGLIKNAENIKMNDVSCFLSERDYSGGNTNQEYVKNSMVNYLWNGNFADGLNYWTPTGTPDSTTVVNDALSPTGRAYKLTKAAASQFGLRQDLLNKTSFVGKRLMATVWVRTNKPLGQDVQIYSSKDVTYVSDSRTVYDDRYTRISIPFTVDSTVNLRIEVRTINSFVADTELYIAAIVLTEGNTFNLAEMPVHPLGILRSSGTSTITSASTGTAATHNLGYFVKSEKINIHPTNSMGVVTKWWVDNIQANSFDIKVDVAPGGVATAEFAWSIDI